MSRVVASVWARRIGAASLCGAFLVLGCGPKKLRLEPKTTNSESYKLPPSKNAPPAVNEPPPLKSLLAATVPERTLGPFLARREGAGMLAYMMPEGGLRKIAAVALDENGGLHGPLRGIAQAAGDVDTMVIRSTGGPRAGFVAAWTSQTERGEIIELVGISDEGTARGQPVELARTSDDIVWLEIVPTAKGAVAIWAEETRDQSANLVAVPLDGDGRPRGVPSSVAKGVRGWQVVPTTMGLGLVLITPASAQTKAAKSDAKPTSLVWSKLDADARSVGAPVTVASRAPIGVDVDVARVESGWVFAWTDRTGFDPQVIVASVDDAGTVKAPAPVVTPIGGATFAGLVSAGSGAALAWEESGRSRGPGSILRLHVGKLDRQGAWIDNVSSTFDFLGDTQPVLVPAKRGVGLMATAPACPTASESCRGAAAAPMFLRLDEKFKPVEVEAIKLRDRRVPNLAWGLDCTRDTCVVLAAVNNGNGSTEVHTAPLPSRPAAYKAPLTPPLPADAPHAVTLETIAAREPFTDVAAARAGEGTLVATLSANEEEDPKKKKPGDTISVRELDASGKPKGEPNVITTRALSVGGVAIAAAPNPDDGAAVVWVAREGTDPQVHITRMDRHGKKLRDQLVTTEKGDASDVALAWAGNGWLVAWVDSRDGNGEVYAARITDQRVSAHERITKSQGDASDLSLVVRGDRAYVAFADPRESPNDGFSDIYVATLRASDAKRLEEARVLATAAHSRSPALVSVGDGLAIGWIEEAPMGTEPSNSAAYGAMFAMLDAKGNRVGEPIRTGGMGPGFPTAVVMAEPKNQGVRAILARSTRDDLSLDAIEWGGHDAPRVYPLLGLNGPPSLDVSLAVVQGSLFYNDGNPEEERVRRLTLGWK